jgi:hypothetical protein
VYVVTTYKEPNVDTPDGTIFSVTYMIDYCGNFFYALYDSTDPQSVDYNHQGPGGATIQGSIVLQSFDGIDVPMSIDVSLKCNVPNNNLHETTKEIYDYFKIIRREHGTYCTADIDGSVVVDGFDFLENPQNLQLGVLSWVKAGEMTITKKVKAE